MNTCHNAFKTAAFHRIKGVGVHPPIGGLSNDHDYTFFGAQYSPCILDPLSFVLPLLALHVSFTTVLLAKLCAGGNYMSQPVEIYAPTE